MTELTFKAAALFDPSAKPSPDLLDALHDAVGMAEHLAKTERFARWLVAAMGAKGLVAKGPFIDEGGWIVETASNGGFVTCIITGPEGDMTGFHLLVSEFAGATDDVARAIQGILADSPEIEGLIVEP